MTEHRIVETQEPDGSTHTAHITVIDDGSRPSSGAGWLIAVVLAAALAVAIYVFAAMGGSVTAKNDAIASAASDVGTAAKQVGDAARTAAEKIGNN